MTISMQFDGRCKGRDPWHMAGRQEAAASVPRGPPGSHLLNFSRIFWL
jgi:hypothetical protein